MGDLDTPTTVDALAFIAPGCAYCPTVIDTLTQLLKTGELRSVELVNAAADPARAAAYGVRSVPWVRIGPFELEGAQTPVGLRAHLERARRGEGLGAHLRALLADGRLAQVEARAAREPAALDEMLAVVADPEAPLQVRLGAGAVLEGLGPAGLAPLVPRFTELAAHPDHRVRADAGHYLGLSAAPAARAPLTALLDDPDAEVREIAREALSALE